MVDAAENLARVARALQKIGIHDAVFVGGAAVAFYISDLALLAPRVTIDVDVVVDAVTRNQFYGIEARLRDAGYQPFPNGPIGRWSIEGVPVDLIPATEVVLGFTNRWYRLLIDSAQIHEIEPGLAVRLATAPMFLAAKLEAHGDRGVRDAWLSRDLTDIVSIVNGRDSLLAEINDAPIEARIFIRSSVQALLADPGFDFLVQAHLPPDDASQQRANIVIARLQRIATG